MRTGADQVGTFYDRSKWVNLTRFQPDVEGAEMVGDHPIPTIRYQEDFDPIALR